MSLEGLRDLSVIATALGNGALPIRTFVTPYRRALGARALRELEARRSDLPAQRRRHDANMARSWRSAGRRRHRGSRTARCASGTWSA